LFTDKLDVSYSVGRWGGEEFIVFFPGLSLQEAKVVLEEARREVLTYDFRLERAVTFSAGIATHREGESLRAIIHRADKALYIAKSS
jgi:diguanylate cyclase (GGDEF)-like protein